MMLITVGEGGYGKVVKVKNKADPDKVFAAKKVNLAKRDVKTSVKKELEILQKLDSPHVIKFVEYFEDPKVAVLVPNESWDNPCPRVRAVSW